MFVRFWIDWIWKLRRVRKSLLLEWVAAVKVQRYSCCNGSMSVNQERFVSTRWSLTMMCLRSAKDGYCLHQSIASDLRKDVWNVRCMVTTDMYYFGVCLHVEIIIRQAYSCMRVYAYAYVCTKLATTPICLLCSSLVLALGVLIL